MDAKGACPNCGGRMLRHRKPLKIRGQYVGDYDAEVCTICKRYYFTEKDYQKALQDAVQKGVITQPENVPGLVLVQHVLASGPSTVALQARPGSTGKSRSAAHAIFSDPLQYSVSVVPTEALS